VEEKTNQHSDWKVNLDIFEGPLDLLLHLINQLEIDISDIPIAKITDQYLNYIHSMDVLELDTAGNYLVMASTLMSIKSQMLVPRNEEFESIEIDPELEENEDPREYLMQLLLEYRKFKEAAKHFKELETSRSFFMTKNPKDVSNYQSHIPLQKDDVELDDLVRLFAKAMNEKAFRNPQPKFVETEVMSVTDRMNHIVTRMKDNPALKMTFTDLIETPSRKSLVTTFLALLELIKNNKVSAKQESIYSEIELFYVTDKNNYNERIE